MLMANYGFAIHVRQQRKKTIDGYTSRIAEFGG